MFICGYHGTSLESASGILNEGFNISNGEKEWLGPGIYFYYSIEDAYSWKDSAAILHSIIKVEDDEYLDIDSTKGALIYAGVINAISESQNKCIDVSTDIEKNQCAVMKMLWDMVPQLKVISSSFPTEKTVIKTLIDVRPRRREFCVRNKDFIKHTHLIVKEDLDA